MPLGLNLLFVFACLNQGVVLPPMPVSLEGTLRETLPIHMSLVLRDGELFGFYHREKQMETRTLSGTINGIGLVLIKEFDGAGKHMGTFEGRFSLKQFKGTWRDPQKPHFLPFELRVKDGRFDRNRAGVAFKPFKWRSPDGACELDFQLPAVTALASDALMKTVNQTLKKRLGPPDPAAECGDASTEFPLTVTSECSTALNAAGFLSFKLLNAFYMQGAAHPGMGYDGLTFDLWTGKSLALKDLFHAGKFAEIQGPLAKEAANLLSATVGDAALELPPVDEHTGWYLREDGIYVVNLFSGHALASLEVPLYFHQIGPLLKPEYRKRLTVGGKP